VSIPKKGSINNSLIVMGTGKEANPYGIPIRRLLLLIIEERKMGLFSRIRDSKKKIAIKSIEMRFSFHFSLMFCSERAPSERAFGNDLISMNHKQPPATSYKQQKYNE
jgi:hypothetical protein